MFKVRYYTLNIKGLDGLDISKKSNLKVILQTHFTKHNSCDTT